MINWEQLKLHHLNPPTYKIIRNDNIQKKYNKYINSLNKSIDNIIIDKYFNKDDKIFCIDKNMFPYYTENNIYHYILWINPTKKINDIEIYNYINLYYCNYTIKKNIIYFENNFKNKSIQNIRHFHIFIKQ